MEIKKPHLKLTGSRTKTAERKVVSLIRRNKSFYLEAYSIEDGKTKETWYVDGGGWVSKRGELQDVQYKHIGHIKNLLKFLDGNQPMWYDPERPEKRSYVRRTIKRGTSF